MSDYYRMKEIKDILFYNQSPLSLNYPQQAMDSRQMPCTSDDSSQDTSFLTATSSIYDFPNYDDQELMSMQPFLPQQQDLASWMASVSCLDIDWNTKHTFVVPQAYAHISDQLDDDATPLDLQRHSISRHLAIVPDISCDIFFLAFKHPKYEASTLRIPMSLLRDTENRNQGTVDVVRPLSDEEQRLLTLLKTLAHYGWATKPASKDCTAQLLDLYNEGHQLVESTQHIDYTKSNNSIMHILTASFERRSIALRTEFQRHKDFLEQRLDIELAILAQYGGSDTISPEKLQKVKKLSKLWEWFNDIPYNYHPSLSQMEHIAMQIGEKVSFVKSWVANKRRSNSKRKAKNAVPSSQVRPALKVYLEKKPFVSS